MVSAVETALERKLSAVMMHGAAKPAIRKVKPGATLTEQGAPGGELFLLLDGVLIVEVDGSALAEVGPGAVLGERAELEGGARTSTLRARTACRVAAVPFDAVDRDQLRPAARPTTVTRTRRARPDRNGQCACTCAACVVRHPHPVRRSPASEGTRRASPLPIAPSRRRVCCSTAGPGCGASLSCSTVVRSKARCCSATCTGTTPRGSRSSAPVTAPTPASTSICRSPTGTPPTGSTG